MPTEGLALFNLIRPYSVERAGARGKKGGWLDHLERTSDILKGEPKREKASAAALSKTDLFRSRPPSLQLLSAKMLEVI